jgi:hypothetical protein
MDGRSRYRFDIVLGLEPGELVRERVTLRAQRRGALLLRERLGSRRLEQLLQILRVGREASQQHSFVAVPPRSPQQAAVRNHGENA